MEMKIIWAAVMFLAGWLWVYLFVRQIMFNLSVASPLIRNMTTLKEEMIAVGARRYTSISVFVCVLVSAVLIFVIVRFLRPYLFITFFAGALICFVLLLPKTKPENRQMFEAFCNSYYRFIIDDELRTAVYNKKYNQVNARLRALDLHDTFVPQFKD